MILPRTMAVVACVGVGGPEVLRIARTELPACGRSDLLIEVRAAGVNGPDIAQRKGSYPPPAGTSPLLGLEVSGRVVAKGADSRDFEIGDAVVALTNGGGYAEFASVPAGQCLPKPTGWTWAEAACLPETFFTVQQALVDRGGVAPGKHVLVHGASGGIGGAAVQLAKLAGATVSAVVSSDAKAEYARSLGANHIINRSRDDTGEAIRQFTAGTGADIIVDLVGGSAIGLNLAVAARNGLLILLAIQGGARGEINLGAVLMKNLTIAGSTLRPQSADANRRIAENLLGQVWPAIATGKIAPPRVTAFALQDVQRAHTHMESGDRIGKVALVMNEAGTR